ncbi:MAG: hypothetical protein ACE5LG_03740 [Anaerolineae bacterium]
MGNIEAAIATVLILAIRLGVPIALLFAMGYISERAGQEERGGDNSNGSTSPLIWPSAPASQSDSRPAG